jgi:hypothetical protein
VFLSNLLPDMLYGVEFWAASWLNNQSNIFWNDDVLAGMLGGSLPLHHHKIVCKLMGDWVEK